MRKKQKLNTAKNQTKVPQKAKVKLGSREIEDGAGHLVELKRLIREHNKDEKQMPIREPDLMIVFTGGKIAYTRPDGVKIIPIGCLKN